MKKRELYRLEPCGDCVIVYRTDNNIGRIGVCFPTYFRREYTHHIAPKYIQMECRELISNNADSVSVFNKVLRDSRSLKDVCSPDRAHWIRAKVRNEGTYEDEFYRYEKA